MLLLLGCRQGGTAAPAPHVSLSGHFECLWWSPQQMEGLNPNNPPPKTTPVTLTKWEYSDPVGIPHPDSVDLVLVVQTDASSGQTFSPSVKISWLEGPMSDKRKAQWTLAAEQPTAAGIQLNRDRPQMVRVPIAIAPKMSELSKRDRWPWALGAEAAIEVDHRVVAGPIHLELPIMPGD